MPVSTRELLVYEYRTLDLCYYWMIKHSKKGLSSLFFRNVPITVSNSPSAPASNAASKSTSASSDVVITSVYGAAPSTPTIVDRFVT